MSKIEKDQLTPEDYKDISRMVESGEIFSDAQEWYLRTYLLTVVERSWLIVLLVALLCLITSAFIYYQSLLPIKSSYAIMVNISDSSEEVARLNYLGNNSKDFDIDEVYARLLSKQFVSAFEAYNWRDEFKLLKSNAEKIKELAYENIQEDYNERISIRKLNSFILKYRKNIIRNITINDKSIEIEKTEEIKDDARKYVVTGTFNATEVGTNINETTRWQFKIILYLRDIEYNYEEKHFEDIYFKVANYEARRI